MPDELARIYDAHAGALYSWLLNLTRAEADTHDLLQELFCKLARQPGLLAGARDERAYLLRLAHHAACDLFRRRASRDRRESSWAEEAPQLFTGAEEPEEEALRLAVAGALAELPEEQRAVVHLKLWEKQTFAEIATTLGISANTAASRYRYALDKLRTRLRPVEDELLP